MNSISGFIELIIEYMDEFGLVIGFLMAFIEPIIPVLPIGVIVGLNMLTFGNVFGFLLSYIASILGGMTSFFLVRYLFKERFVDWFLKKDRTRIDKWMKKISEIDFNALVVLFAIPITPVFLVNIAGALSDISYKKYFAAMIIGKPAMLLFYGYIAVSFVDSLNNPMNLIKIGLLILGAYLASKIIEKIVKVEK